MINSEGFKSIIEESKDYLDSKIELTKLDVAEKSSKGISKLLVFLIIGACFLLVCISISLFIGFMLSDYFDSFVKGFGLLSLIYLSLFIVLLLLKNKILARPIQNNIIKEFFKDE